jgi:DNA-binding Lrp family transcriptional regulator
MILLNTEMGAERKVLQKLRTLKGVTEAHQLFSVYDLAVKVKAPNMQELKDTITHKIMKTPGFQSILTLVTVEEEHGAILDLQASVNPPLFATC